MTVKLDHLVVAASTLEQGVAYIQDTLGVDIPKGGEHPLMGTHNHLMNIGGETFLEVIAINPDRKAPSRPSWFGLDDNVIRHSLVDHPRLLTWAVNTDDIAKFLSSTQFQFGTATPVTRGELNWLFGLPDDGRLIAGGMLPHVLQWQTDKHPAINMSDLNCRLVSLKIYHPYAQWIEAILKEVGAEQIAEVVALEDNATPYLSVEIETPSGLKVLDSRFRFD